MDSLWRRSTVNSTLILFIRAFPGFHLLLGFLGVESGVGQKQMENISSACGLEYGNLAWKCLELSLQFFLNRF